MQPIPNPLTYLRYQRGAHGHYTRHIAKAGAALGLTVQESEVLLFLSNNPGMDTARDMVEYRGFSKAYASGAVDGLLKKGLVEARVDPADRRLQHLRLTSAAKAPAARLQAAQQAFFSALFAGVSQQEWAVFSGVLGKITENMRKIQEK